MNLPCCALLRLAFALCLLPKPFICNKRLIRQALQKGNQVCLFGIRQPQGADTFILQRVPYPAPVVVINYGFQRR